MKMKAFVIGLCAALTLSACATSEQQTETALSADTVQNLVSGNTLSGSTIKRAQFAIYLNADGTAIGELSEVRDTGTWEILADGRLCTAFSNWEFSTWAGGNTVCHLVYRTSTNYALYDDGRLDAIVTLISPGNPRNL